MNRPAEHDDRRNGSRRLAAAAAVLVVICSVIMAGSALAAPGGGFGPSPGEPQSRCAALVVSSHIGFPGKELTATAGPAMPGSCGGGKVGWSWEVPAVVKGCRPDSTNCTFRAGASSGNAWQQVCILGSSTQGPWQSCDYFGVPAKGTGIVEGFVKDKDGGPVAGADVTAYGAGYGRRGASASTGADGFYAISVKAGHYSVFPSGGPHGKSKATYSPSDAHVEVSDGGKEKADFELKAGIELGLEFAHSSVLADGLQVLKGTITTTEFGKPAPNVQVQLDPLPGTSSATLGLNSPRAAICYAGGRVWPTGTLSEPDYYPVTVTTDATGHYDFTLTVGTTPGTWRLDAWAFDSAGKLSSDTTAASDTKSVTFESSGSRALANFVNEFNIVAKSTAALSTAAPSASALIPLLSQITASGGKSGPLAGYAYGLVNAPDGQSLLVFPGDQAPAVSKAGDVGTGSDLVLDPTEWTGHGLTLTNASSLQYVVQKGLLPDVPTLSQFTSGASVQGWNTAHGSAITLFSQSFEYLGWGYPGSTPGSCY